MNKKCFKATDYNAPFIEQRADPFQLVKKASQSLPL